MRAKTIVSHNLGVLRCTIVPFIRFTDSVEQLSVTVCALHIVPPSGGLECFECTRSQLCVLWATIPVTLNVQLSSALLEMLSIGEWSYVHLTHQWNAEHLGVWESDWSQVDTVPERFGPTKRTRRARGVLHTKRLVLVRRDHSKELSKFNLYIVWRVAALIRTPIIRNRTSNTK